MSALDGGLIATIIFLLIVIFFLIRVFAEIMSALWRR